MRFIGRILLAASLALAFTACDRDRGQATGTPDVAAAPSNAADAALQQRIRDSISANQSLSAQARAVNVTADDGVVTLTGVVATDSEKEAIEQIAERAVGDDGRVENEVKVATAAD
jgi:osmotically-inducible protein OsmY